MKLRLEADPGELRERSSELLAKLSKALREHAPEAADALEKALPVREVELRDQALRDMHQQAKVVYQTQMTMMLAEISDVLENRVKEMENVSKAEGADVVSIVKGE